VRLERGTGGAGDGESGPFAPTRVQHAAAATALYGARFAAAAAAGGGAAAPRGGGGGGSGTGGGGGSGGNDAGGNDPWLEEGGGGGGTAAPEYPPDAAASASAAHDGALWRHVASHAAPALAGWGSPADPTRPWPYKHDPDEEGEAAGSMPTAAHDDPHHRNLVAAGAAAATAAAARAARSGGGSDTLDADDAAADDEWGVSMERRVVVTPTDVARVHRRAVGDGPGIDGGADDAVAVDDGGEEAEEAAEPLPVELPDAAGWDEGDAEAAAAAAAAAAVAQGLRVEAGPALGAHRSSFQPTGSTAGAVEAAILSMDEAGENGDRVEPALGGGVVVEGVPPRPAAATAGDGGLDERRLEDPRGEGP
jgi:hypothetical protein